MTAARDAGFDAALAGRSTRLLDSDGRARELAVARWLAPAAGDDRWLLDRCSGPLLDVGCGPGRLVVALLARGVPAVGVDVSATAQRLCRDRGAPMLRGDVFGPLPRAWGGRPWAQVLLADGNIGIGGDPRRLLARAGDLLGPDGSVLVETDPDPRLCWRGSVRLPAAGAADVLPWARLGADALVDLARPDGWCPTAAHTGPRSFVQLRRVRRRASRPAAA